MKGTITRCLAMMVKHRAGDRTWAMIVEDAQPGPEAGMLELASADVSEAIVMRLLVSTCKVMRLTPGQAYDMFGEYWCCEYAPKTYASTFRRFKSAREMILGMDEVHVEITRTMEKARPPRFDYTWKDQNTLVVKYKSPRNLGELYAGLVRGAGKYFKEALEVKMLSSDQIQIKFP